MADEKYLVTPSLGEALGLPDVPPRRSERDLLDYYLGGTGIPQRASAAHDILNPLVGLSEASYYSGQAFRPDLSPEQRREAALQALVGTIAAAGPAAIGAKLGGEAADVATELLTGISAAPGQALDLQQQIQMQDFLERNQAPDAEALAWTLSNLKGQQYFAPGSSQATADLVARSQANDPVAAAYFDSLNRYVQDSPVSMREGIEDYGILDMPQLDSAGNPVGPSYPLYIAPDPVSVSKSEVDRLRGQPGVATAPISNVVRGGAEPLTGRYSTYSRTTSEIDDEMGPNSASYYPSGTGWPHVVVGSGDAEAAARGVAAATDPELARSFVHESVHSLMDEPDIPESFAGTSVKAMSEAAKARVTELNRQIRDETDPAEKARLKAARDGLRQLTSFELYHRNPGEQIARVAEGDIYTSTRLSPSEVLNPYLSEGPFLQRLRRAAITSVTPSARMREVDRILENIGESPFATGLKRKLEDSGIASLAGSLKRKLGFGNTSNTSPTPKEQFEKTLERRFGRDAYFGVYTDPRRSISEP